MKIIQDLMTILEADEGHWITDGESYGRVIYLSIHDSPSNWHEVSEEEVPEDVRIPIENHIPDEIEV